MSFSAVASTFAQSIRVARALLLDILAIALNFVRAGFAERYDADCFAPPCEGREEDAALNLPEGADADFAIVFSLVFPFQSEASEETYGGGKRQTAFPLVLRTLGRIEFDAQEPP